MAYLEEVEVIKSVIALDSSGQEDEDQTDQSRN
jgi:hypothetical protein